MKIRDWKSEGSPNPGSKEAVALGCTCPVIDNHYGEGVPDGEGGTHWWHNGSCEIHGLEKLEQEDDSN